MDKIDWRNELAVVIIGRNEGERLVRCLSSISKSSHKVIYVDSNSTDESIENAKKAGATVLNLDMSIPFSAARARNEGWKYLYENHPDIKFVQFVDGDCEVQPNWFEDALKFMSENSQYAIVSGLLSERHPEKSIYNQLCDDEWNSGIGESDSCGGNALIRMDCLVEVDGYKNYFIAGEEPEMCFRIRQKGWKIFKLNKKMALHDANMTEFSQWWQRAKRYGFSVALTYSEYKDTEHDLGKKELLRSLGWSVFTCIILLASLVNLNILFFLTLFPIQILKMFLSNKDKNSFRLKSCFFLMLAKFPETIGIISFAIKKARRQPYTLIEYK